MDFDPDVSVFRIRHPDNSGRTWASFKTVNWKIASDDFVSDVIGRAIASDGTNTSLLQTANGGKTWTELLPIVTSR